MSSDQLREVDFVLTDIDDTLTSDGRLPALAYAALEKLTLAGLIVVPVTGRPAGWCDMIARLWPVAAVIGENGAFYFAKNQGGGMARFYETDEATRARQRLALRKLSRRIAEVVPHSRVAADQPFRESDLAIDFAEDVARLDEAAIDRIVACFEEAGAVAKISSIHVNGWFGTHDKLSMTRRILQDRFACDIAFENRRILYAGDSPNDGPMFAFFEKGVAVANYRAGRSPAEELPRYITRGSGGEGFAEIAERILSARKS
jgi:hypothetical protein